MLLKIRTLKKHQELLKSAQLNLLACQGWTPLYFSSMFLLPSFRSLALSAKNIQEILLIIDASFESQIKGFPPLPESFLVRGQALKSDGKKRPHFVQDGLSGSGEGKKPPLRQLEKPATNENKKPMTWRKTTPPKDLLCLRGRVPFLDQLRSSWEKPQARLMMFCVENLDSHLWTYLFFWSKNSNPGEYSGIHLYVFLNEQ